MSEVYLLADEMEELSFSEWPDPPGGHPWLPAYGFQANQDHTLEKEDFLDPADAALFLGGGISVGGTGSFLETILEETSEDLCSDGESSRPPCWLDDSDADSVIHVPHLPGKDDFDSGSERDYLCPAKRRRPNQGRQDCPSPSDTTSLSLSLSRSSSLAQFESLEQSCQLLEASAPPSPLSLLSVDSLEKFKINVGPELSPDSLENSSDSEPHSSSSQESAYMAKIGYRKPLLESHFNDRSLTEERFDGSTFIVSAINKSDDTDSSTNYFANSGITTFWNATNGKISSDSSSSSEFSDARSSDSEHTVHENVSAKENAHKYNFKSCRSLDALTSFENLDTSKIEGMFTNIPDNRYAQKQTNQQYSVENLSEDSGYSDHFCNFLKFKSKSIPNVNSQAVGDKAMNKNGLKRKSDDNLLSLFKTRKRNEATVQFGAKGKYQRKPLPDAESPAYVRREMALTKRGGDKQILNGNDGRCEGKRGTPRTEIASECVGQVALPHMRGVARSRPARSLPDISEPALSEFDKYLDPKGARNTFPKSVGSRLADLIELEDCSGSEANLYSVSSVPKDLNLCDVVDKQCHSSLDDNWSFGSERGGVSVAAKNFDLCDFAYPKKSRVHEATFKQSFRVCDSFTTSVADLTVLDYRCEQEGVKNVLMKYSHRSSEKHPKMQRKSPPTRERSAESDSTTESEKVFLFEMEKTMRELNEQSRKILASTFNDSEFDRNISILTNKRLNAQLKPFDDVIAELEKKQARSKTNEEKETVGPSKDLKYEFNYYGDDADPPYYRRNFEISTPNTEDSSPDVSESFSGGDNLFYHSTPIKGTDKVQSTPNLNIYNAESADLYSKVAPKEELRSSMQHVPLKNEFKPVGILGSKSQGLSGSSGSKGVHFCPVVAEVSWRERSYSEDSTGMASSNSSAFSCSEEEGIDEGSTAPGPEARPEAPAPKAASAHAAGGASPPAPTPAPAPVSNSAPTAAHAPAPAPMEPAAPPAAPAPPAKPARSRIGGFLSRFANFRFSARKSKKPPPSAQQQHQQQPPSTAPRNEEPPPAAAAPMTEAKEPSPEYVYIPLKGRPPLPPGAGAHRAPRPHPPAPAPQAGLLETDLDTATTRTLPAGARARSLLALPPPPPQPRSHKSMEYLLDKDNRTCVEPPENDLQKNSSDRVLSEHQLRVQRSLQKLNLPDWYKNSAVPREGFLLKKRASDAGASARGWEASGLGSKTTSLGSLGGSAQTRSPLALTPPSQQLGFTRWSTSRLNSAQTSPCSSARSSVRGGAISPLTSPARPPRAPRPTRAPYLGWRSQERLASPRTPNERLAVSLLPQSPPVTASVSDEIQSSIKEVTSAIVHYVSGLEPNHDKLAIEADNISASPRNSPRLCWLESSFVGTKPLESPQTPIVVANISPPSSMPTNQRPLQLDIPSIRPTANGNVTHSTTTYQHDWQSSQHSLLNLGINKPSPGSTTLEDVLDSLLGLPSSVPRNISPLNSPRRATSPYYVLGLQNRYSERSNSQTSSLQISLSSKTDDRSEYHSAINYTEESCNSVEYSKQDSETTYGRRPSAESGSCSTLAPGMDGADKEDCNNIVSWPKSRVRAKSVTPAKNSSRRQSEPAAANKSHSLDRRVSYDSHISKGEVNSLKTSSTDNQQSKTSLKSIASINTDGSGEDLVHCRYTKCTSATTPTDAKRNYKSCHNCSYLYCSRECRRAHWERHRKVCLHSRASTLCRQILSTAKEDADSLHHISLIAQRGYLSQGRGAVKVFFTSPDAAEKFTTNGFQNLGEPLFVKWPDLMPNEMGPELYAELVKLCKNYNPETRLVLYVAVCIVSEVPTKGAAVKWERQIVSRCAKLRLSNTIITNQMHSQISITSSPKPKLKNKGIMDNDLTIKTKSTDTLILTSNLANLHQKNNISVQKVREISFNNIQTQLQKRGVNLKRHYPEVYVKLCSYVEGTCDKFTPISIYPRDNSTGKSFMCVIMPETESEKFQALPSDGPECRTIDVSIDRSDQASTPM